MPSQRGKKLKQLLRPLACAVLVAGTWSLASAQTGSTFIGPKVATRGSNQTALAGSGSVTVQVFVKKDGTYTTAKVVKSTNSGDEAAALEIAKSSKYKPATRDGNPVDAYYDYVLTFGGDTAATGTGPLAAALASIRAGKYDDAKATLQTYIQANPSDTQAYTLLGVANTFGGDPAAASAAFDKAGTIPDQYKTLALQSYTKYASAALADKKFAEVIAATGRVLQLDPQNLEAYFMRGNAQAGAGNDAAAIADLQKAHAMAVASKLDDKSLASISYSLAIAQLDAGQYGEAATSAKEVAHIDGPRSAQIEKYAYVSVSNAAIALANAGKIAESVSRFESGANAFPANAGEFYAQAAFVLATDKKPDWDKIKAEANKALALNPNSGRAEYVLGIAAANKNDLKTAKDYMTKAKASPDYADATLAKQIDAALKQLNTPQ
jgi:TonB family protein